MKLRLHYPASRKRGPSYTVPPLAISAVLVLGSFAMAAPAQAAPIEAATPALTLSDATATPPQQETGMTVEYSAKLTVTTADTTDDTVLTHTLPAGKIDGPLTVKSGSDPDSACTVATNVVTCTYPAPLAANATKTPVIVAKLKGSAGDVVADAVTATSTGATSATPVNPEATIKAAALADVALSFSSRDTTVDKPAAGSTSSLTYFGSVQNDSAVVAKNVKTTITLPATATFVTASPEDKCLDAAGTVTCSFGELPGGGGNQGFQIFASVGDSVNEGDVLKAKAEVTADNLDPAGTAHKGEVDITVIDPNKPEKLTLTEPIARPAKQVPGDYISFSAKMTTASGPILDGKVTVVHELSGPVENVRVPAGPPDNVGCTAGGMKVTCDYTGLAVGATKTATISADVVAGATVGAKITDVVTADTGGSKQAKLEIPAEVGVAAEPKAKLTLPVGLTAKAGADVAAVLEVANVGQGADPPLPSPEVTITLPATLTFKSDARGKCTAAGQSVTCTYDNLPTGNPNASKVSDELTLTVKADADADGTVDAKLTKPVLTTAPTASSPFTLIREPKLAVVTDPAGPDLGDVPADPTSPVEVKTAVSNTGNGPATTAGYTVAFKNATGGYAFGPGATKCKKTTDTLFTCSFDGLAAKAATPDVTFRTSADPAAVGQNIEITVTPTLDGTPVPGDVTLKGKITKAGSLVLVLDPASLDKVIAGDAQQISATLENKGAADVVAAGLDVNIFNEADATVSGADSAKCTKTGSGGFSCAFGDMKGGAKIPLVFQVTPDVTQVGKQKLQVNFTPKVAGSPVDDQKVFMKGEIVSPFTLDTKVEPAKVGAGQTVRFKAQVTNVAANDIQNVAIEHTVSDNLEITKVAPPCTMAGQTVQCQLNPVKPGASFPADDGSWIEAKVRDQATGDLVDSVNAKASVPGSNNDFAEQSAELRAQGPVPTNADLAMSLTARQKLVKSGDKINYVLQVNNLGPEVASPSTVALKLDGPVASVQAGGPCTATGTDVTCDVPELKAASQTWGIGVVVTTLADGAEDVVGTAIVTPGNSTKDPNLDNNKSEAKVKVGAAADFQVTATGTPETAVAGKDWVTYNVAVLSLGPATEAKNVQLTGVIPAFAQKQFVASGMRRVRADDCTFPTATTVLCKLGDVKLGTAVKVISLKGLVAPTATAELKASFKAASDSPATDPSGATAEVATKVTASADTAVTGKVGKLGKGKTGLYTITVVNNGPSNAAKASLSAKLPKYLKYSKVSGTGCKKSGNGIACSWSTLKPKQKVAIKLYAKVDKKGKGSPVTKVTVTSGTPDPNKKNNIASIKGKITK